MEKKDTPAAAGFPAFHLFVSPGDFVGFSEPGDPGLFFRAEIIRDGHANSGGPAKMSDGFWPSLSPKSAGYIGAGKTRADLAADRERCEALVRAWEAGSLFYCGIVVTAYRDGREIASDSLWGLEANYPALPVLASDDPAKRPNAYLDEVAGDCLANVRRELEPKAAAGEWSGSPCPDDPDNFWIDDATGERRPA